MTAPAVYDPAVIAALELADQHEAAMQLLEQDAVAMAVGTAADIVKAMTAGLVARWVTAFGGVRSKADDPAKVRQIVTWLTKQLTGIGLKPSVAITEHGPQARALGAKQAREAAGMPAPRPVEPKLSDAAKQAATKQDDAATQKLTVARRLLEQHTEAEHYGELLPAIAQAQHAVTGAENAVTWAVHHEANEGVRNEADRLGADLIWLNERDACVHCLAYAGEIGDLQHGFETGQTYGDHPLVPWPDAEELPGPPLHPRCRCHMQLWFGEHRGQRGLPEALRHEAERSILKGWSKPSESPKVRLRAAERLLERGTDLPKSVQNEARTAVKRGRFGGKQAPRPAVTRKTKASPRPAPAPPKRTVNIPRSGNDAVDAAPLSITSPELDSEARSALRQYKGVAYTPTNQYLRAGSGGFLRDQVETLDATIEGSPLTASVSVFRGIRDARSVFGDRVDGELTGMEWIEHAYLSTSADVRVADEFAAAGGMMLSVIVPKGAPMVVLSPFAKAGEQPGQGGKLEAELLGGRGWRLRVTEDHGVIDGVRHIDVEVVSHVRSGTDPWDRA